MHSFTLSPITPSFFIQAFQSTPSFDHIPSHLAVSHVVVENACRLCILVLLAKSLKARGLHAMALGDTATRTRSRAGVLGGSPTTNAVLLTVSSADTLGMSTDLVVHAAYMFGQQALL